MEWGYEAECAMEELKNAVRQAQGLAVWENAAKTRLSTDASNVGMGALVEQQNERGEWLTVAAWSKKLNTSQQNYSATDKEWLAVVESVSRVWRHWLLGKEFTIRTDHAALQEILTRKGEDFTPRQLRWWEKLEPYSFKVEYIKGQENVVPDALSRTPAFYVNALELTPQGVGAIGLQDLKDASLKDPKY